MSDALLNPWRLRDCDIFIRGLRDDEPAMLVWILITVSVWQCSNGFVMERPETAPSHNRDKI